MRYHVTVRFPNAPDSIPGGRASDFEVWQQFGDSSARRVVDALGLKEGDNIEIVVARVRNFEVARAPGPRDVLARMRKCRGRLPADFKLEVWLRFSNIIH